MITLSVIVIAGDNLALLQRCLQALEPQLNQTIEVLVVTCGDNELASEFLQLRWFSAPDGFTIPQRRSIGIEQSRGTMVALLEDDCMVNRHWCANVINAHQADNAAIGGPVEPDCYDRPLDWAVFYCDYARYLSPFSGTVAALSGNNVSYKRTVLNTLDYGNGFYEVFCHWQLQQQGETLLADESLAVQNCRRWTWDYILRIPYHHGRAFAAQRLANAARSRRLLFTLMTLALPLLQTYRIIRAVSSRKRSDLPLLRVIPWIGLHAISWSWGEFCGYLAGPGNSIKQWR